MATRPLYDVTAFGDLSRSFTTAAQATSAMGRNLSTLGTAVSGAAFFSSKPLDRPTATFGYPEGKLRGRDPFPFTPGEEVIICRGYRQGDFGFVKRLQNGWVVVEFKHGEEAMYIADQLLFTGVTAINRS